MTRTVGQALRDARVEVDRFHRRSLTQGHTAGEETLTDVLLVECGDTVRYAKFNKRQEGTTGADWLWWFVADNGECVGMLVQAKCLHKKPMDRWSVDLAYGDPPGKQVRSLIAAAQPYGVPACYVLYCGDEEHRDGFGCDRGGAGCRGCRERSVSVLAAPLAQGLVDHEIALKRLNNWSQRDAASWAESGVRQSVALERIVDQEIQHGRAFDRLSGSLENEIRKPTSEPRAVAAVLFHQMRDHRQAQLSSTLADPTSPRLGTAATDRIFSQ